MSNRRLGSLISSVAAGMFVTSMAFAEGTKPAAPAAPAAGADHAAPAATAFCMNNQCAGKSACMGHGNETCAGKNTCKGHGWLKKADKAACEKDGHGKWHQG